MVSMIRKESAIWDWVARISSVFGGEAFTLVDHWEGDFCAIGIGNPSDGRRRLVYLCTFGEKAGFCGYDCEELNAHGLPHILEEGSEADLKKIVEVLTRHLGIVPKAAA
jgi:hypothetical protein